MDKGPSAGVTVEIFPMGSGQVLFQIVSIGPVHLSRGEMIHTLRAAVDQLESSHPEGEPKS